MNEEDQALSGVIYFLAAVAILGNAFVVLCFALYIKSSLSVTTQLLLLLHVSAILESIASLPSAFTGNESCCKTMGVLHYYFGLVIMGVVVSLTVLLYNYIHKNDPTIEDRIQKYGIPFILTFSLITLLPLSVNGYGVSNDVWCSISYNHHSDNAWAFGTFYIWALIAWIISIVFIIYLSYTVIENELKMNAFKSVASYIIATLFTIGPRLFPRLINLFIDLHISYDAQFLIQGGIYISTVLYCFCFFLNKKKIKEYERRTLLTESQLSANNFLTVFDWSFSSRSWSSTNSSAVNNNPRVPLRRFFRTWTESSLGSKSNNSGKFNNPRFGSPDKYKTVPTPTFRSPEKHKAFPTPTKDFW